MSAQTLIDAAFLCPRYCGGHTIHATVFDRRLLSTVKACRGSAAPFETVLFGRNGEPINAWYYATRGAAKRGHWAVCLVHLQSQ